ncbi:hypothetical protein LCGC14_2088400 [marine sediment metagenome]|uniref:Uncharacterized protein n=1 Tax=marine sediment metagenome TaxID=412755 RepID=A0A0F9EDD1_9ZZZZ
MVSQASKNIEDIILQERFRYMTQPTYDDLHNTILRYLDGAVSDPETDLSKLAEMIIQEVTNVKESN